MFGFLDNISNFIDDKIFIPLLKFSEKHPNLPMIISLISLLVSIIKWFLIRLVLNNFNYITNAL